MRPSHVSLSIITFDKSIKERRVESLIQKLITEDEGCKMMAVTKFDSFRINHRKWKT